MDKLKKELLEWGKALVFAVLVFIVVNFFFSFTTVYNVSMYPTLQEKDKLFMVKFGAFERGDIVSYRSELTITEKDHQDLEWIQKWFHKVGERKNLIKRVIAVPGDTIEINGDTVYVNDVALVEPYVSSNMYGMVEKQVLPEGKYFLMGDNRDNSIDSRALGLIDEEDFIGKVVFRFFPFNRLGGVNG